MLMVMLMGIHFYLPSKVVVVADKERREQSNTGSDRLQQKGWRPGPTTGLFGVRQLAAAFSAVRRCDKWHIVSMESLAYKKAAASCRTRVPDMGAILLTERS